MRRPSLPLLLGLVLLAVTFLLWEPRRNPASKSAGDPAEVRNAQGLESPDSLAAAAALSPTELRGAPLPDSAALSSRDFFGWTGTVLEPDGTPAVGARVFQFQDWGRVFEARCDGEGRFRLAAVRHPMLRNWTPWRIWVQHQGFSAPETKGVPPASPPPPLQIQLEGGFAVAVEVVEEDSGLPIQGAVVELDQGGHEALGTTNSAGWATVYVPSPGFAILRLEGSGTAASASYEWVLIDADSGPHRFQIRARRHTSQIRIHAVDAETNAALADATFAVTSPIDSSENAAIPATAQTLVHLPSPGGTLDYTPPSPAGPVWVLVEAPGYLPLIVRQIEWTRDSNPVQLLRDVGITAVIRIHGRPPPGPCRVRWTHQPYSIAVPDKPGYPPSAGRCAAPVLPVQIWSDAQGRFTFPWRPRDYKVHETRLEVDVPGWAEAAVLKLSLKKGDLPAQLTLELGVDFRTLPLQVVDHEGRAVAGATVDLIAAGERRAARLFRGLDRDGGVLRDCALYPTEFYDPPLPAQGETGHDGRADLVYPAGQVCRWRVWHDGFMVQGILDPDHSPDPRAPFLIRLPAPATLIRGRLVEADGSRPSVPGITIYASSAKGRDLQAEVQGDGSFVITGCAPRLYHLSLVVGRELISSGLGAVEAGEPELLITLPPWNTCRVKPVDATNGAPISDFMADWRTAEEEAKDFSFGPHARDYHSLIEPIELWVTAEGYLARTVDLRAMRPEQLQEIVLPMEPARTIRLTLRDAAGEAADWDRVLWLTEEGSEAEDPGDRDEDDTGWIWRSAPKAALRFQFVDEDGKPLSEVIEIPTGEGGVRSEVLTKTAADGHP